jgi:quercetin dioxygenase-like cupin family protein
MLAAEIMDEQQALALKDVVSDRTPRPLMGSVLNFNLPQEVSALRGEPAYKNGHNARTLIKHSEFRVVLVVLGQGAEVHEQKSSERIALQPISGHVRLQLAAEVVNLHADQLLSLDRDISYRIAAVEDSAILLWVGWSKDPAQGHKE